MWAWLSRLLDLETLREADPESISLRWQLPWAQWVVFATVLLAVAFVALTYDRERVRARVRIPLTVLRALLVCLVIALLCRPVLVWERTREEPSVTAVLFDQSESMTLRDMRAERPATAPADDEPPTAEPIPPVDEAYSAQSADWRSRREALFSACLPSAGQPPLDALLRTNQLALYGFGGAVYSRGLVRDGARLNAALTELRDAPADELTTDIAGAVETVLAEAPSGRLAALILASDGRSTVPADYRRLAEMAKRRRVPVFPILLGSPTPPVDVEVGPLLADENVFVKDILAVTGTLTTTGGGAGEIGLQLFEEGRDEPLSTQTLTLSGADEAHDFEFRSRPFRPGPHRYRVVADARPGEITLENNSSGIEVNAIEDKTRVLYVEGVPRFEYRYLKNTLLREPTIVSSILLLDADEGFAQEGTAPIRRLPETEKELFEYDVVIFGDVDPRVSTGEQLGWITQRQAELLVDFVGRRGGGFVLVAGERAAPQTFRGTPLEKLLPVMIDSDYLGYSAPLPEDRRADGTAGYRLTLTPEAQTGPVFRFVSDPQLNQEILASLPLLYWYAPTLGPKPAAEVLAQHPLARTLSGAMPVIVAGRYGAGRIYYHGTDDTWMWRRRTGEAFYDTYWLQVIRFCAENRLIAQSRAARLATDRKEYDYGGTVRVTLTLISSDLAESLPAELEVRFRRVDDDRGGTCTVTRLGPKSRTYEGSFTPPGQGNYALSAEVVAPSGEVVRPEVQFRVRPGNLERAARSADHESLILLAEQTGGRALTPDRLAELAEVIPDRSVRIPDDVAEPIWDTRLFLALLVLILSIEWGLRKWFGLI